MGAGKSLELTLGDSIVTPGQPSVLSEEIKFDREQFLSEIWSVLKYPVAPVMEAVLKECKVIEGASPDEFEVMVILDGTQLSNYGFGNKEDPGRDLIAVNNKVKWSRSENYMSAENYERRWDGEEAKLLICTRADFTQDPFRMDYYNITPDGQRIANEAVKQGAQPIVNAAVSALSSRQVTMKLDDERKLIFCDPIPEDIVTYDALFDAVVYCLKDANPTNLVVEDLTETKFRLSAGEGDPRQNFPNVQMWAFDKDKGTISMDLMSVDETSKLASTYYTISQSPLTLEMYIVKGKERFTGTQTQKVVQALMDNALAKAQASGWGLGLF